MRKILCFFFIIFRESSSDANGENTQEEHAESKPATQNINPAPKSKSDSATESMVERHSSMLNKFIEDADDIDTVYFQFCTKRIKPISQCYRSWLRVKIEQNFNKAERLDAQSKSNPAMHASLYYSPPMNNMAYQQGQTSYEALIKVNRMVNGNLLPFHKIPNIKVTIEVCLMMLSINRTINRK